MIKYSNKLRIEIVKKCLYQHYSMNGLAKKYNINNSTIQSWCYLAKQQGLSALKIKHKKAKYNIDFKLNVVKYYQTHGVSYKKLAAKFNLNHSQVYSWVINFNSNGTTGLKPHKKGRPLKMTKNQKNKIHFKKDLTLSEKYKYEEKIAKLEAELRDARLDQYILKQLRAMGYYQTK